VFPGWFRSSFNRSSVLLISSLLPGVANADSVLPSLLQQVQSEYQKVAGIQAQFSQITEIKSTHQTKRAKGRVWIKRPGKLRWETLEPDPNILVSDGKVYWFYTPPFDESERGQVIIRKKAQVQTQFLNALLSGSFDFGKGKVAIEEKSKNTFLLRPKPGTAGDVSSAEIEIDPARKTISKVNLVHVSGNQTRVQLEEVSLTSKLDEALFRFKIDNNTDKIVE
jgi:outer membrane lipoprotein carrier protein